MQSLDDKPQQSGKRANEITMPTALIPTAEMTQESVRANLICRSNKVKLSDL